MGGLLAARVLADAYRRVTIVERDPLPEIRGWTARGFRRAGTHGLLPSGAQVLDELFPGLLADLVTDGVPVLRAPREFRFFFGGRPLCQDGGRGEPSYLPSRPCLEAHVRDRVRALPNVSIQDQCEVAGLVTTPARTGSRCPRAAARGRRGPEILAADLVVDATGRGGRTAAWLKEIGYDPPAEEQLRVDIKYASRHLRLRAGALGDEKLILVGAQPGRPAAMALFAQEGNRWILTLAGYAGHHPPVDEDGFLAFARGVAPPHVFAAIRDAEPLDEIRAHRFPANLRRRYNGCAGSPPGCWWSGTRSAASTRSTGRACPWPRWKRSHCGTAWPAARPNWPAGSSGPPPSRSASPGS